MLPQPVSSRLPIPVPDCFTLRPTTRKTILETHSILPCLSRKEPLHSSKLFTLQHLHHDLLEDLSLSASEALTLVEACVTSLEVPQSDGDSSSKGVICDDRAPVLLPQEGQQPHTVCAHHALAWPLLSQLATPGLSSSPVPQGIIST